MIEIFIHKNQLFNFLFLKEPVILVPNPLDENYIKFCYNIKDIHFEVYKTYTTVELMTFRKKVRLWMKKLKKNKK